LKKLALLLAFALALVVALGASADNGNGNGNGNAPQRDNGHGHWYKHACGNPTGHNASCDVTVVTDSAGSPAVSASPPASAMTPANLTGAYGLTGDGTGQTIGIVDAFDDPTAASDLATFSSQFGIPCNGCFQKVNQTGGTSYPGVDSGWSLEVALDVETAHGICPNCKILLVEANSNSFADLGAAENEAVALGADVISNSWGGSEFSGETSLDTDFNHPGVAITASSGDGGYGVEYPAASPYVTAVGGTSLHVNGNTWASETAWSGSGSGCSAYEPKPSWQKDTGCTRRTVADVSADADPNTGEAIYASSYSTPGWYQVGGTSLASPLIASVYALAGVASSGASGAYASAGSLHDITSGTNGSCGTYLCNAVVGFDGPTGLGTPIGLAFTAGSGGGGNPPPPAADFTIGTLAASSQPTPGGSATYAVTVTPNASFTSPVGLSATGLPSGATASFNPGSISTGSSTLTVSTSGSIAVGTYSFTITGTGGGVTHSVAASLTVKQAVPTGDFSLSVSPSSATISRTGTTTYTVTISRSNFTSAVSFSVVGMPFGMRSSFSQNPTTASSVQMSVTTTVLPMRSSWKLTITGSGGNKSHTTTLRLSTA
jgi:subtilase family serine protease